MRRSIGIITLLFLFLSSTTIAYALDVKQLKILDYGVYRYDQKIIVVTNPPEGSKKNSKLSNISRVDKSANLPIQKDTFFSITYVIESEPSAQLITVDLKISRPDGMKSSGLFTVRTGDVTTNVIEVSSEDVPGNYLFEIEYKNRNLLKQEITVYKP